MIKINKWLLPFSWLYGVAVGVRNKLFDWGILKSRSFDIPIIAVGNITVGGSGKTPHVEYLIRLLQDQLKVAVLSRGYKRRSHGFVLADTETSMKQIGDEPYQMKHKFPNIHVAVDEKRCHGIDMLTENDSTKNTDVILLDDAFQHRYVKPGINILLIDYHRLIIHDTLLPAGRLREPQSGKDRADVVIVTKCPNDLKAIDFRVLTKALKLFPYQDLYFTRIEYCDLLPVWGNGSITLDSIKDKNILLLSGIASPQQMAEDIKDRCKSITPVFFPDHHTFKEKDVMQIKNVFDSIPEPKLIVTTEKDATRLQAVCGLNEEIMGNCYVIPIKVKFMLDQEPLFNQKIISYVHKNSRNSILVKGKDDHKPDNSNNTGNGTRTISFRNY